MKSMHSFVTAEDGSVSAWNLVWFSVFALLLGIAMDSTAAHNTKARLQVTADAVAHAAIIDLLDPTGEIPLDEREADSTATGLIYSNYNMTSSVFGDVTLDQDITFGTWEFGGFVLDDPDDDIEPNAVHVTTRRTVERNNELAATFMRVIGFYNWDVYASAVVAANIDGVDDCRQGGLIAGGLMSQTSNNTLINEICLHGQVEVKLNNNNLIECGVVISMPDVGTDMKGAWNGKVSEKDPCDPDPSEPGYRNPLTTAEKTMLEHALNSEDVISSAVEEYLAMGEILNARMAGPLDEDTDPYETMPDYITKTESVTSASFNIESVEPGTLYEVVCNGNGGKISISGIVRNIAILTNCSIDFTNSKIDSGKNEKDTTGSNKCDASCLDPEVPEDSGTATTYEGLDANGDPIAEFPIVGGASVVLDNVTIYTTATGQNSVKFSQGVQVGRQDNCGYGGGAQIYLDGSLHSPSSATFFGARIVSTEDVNLAAQADSVLGISVEAAGDINIAAQGRFGACPPYSDDSSYAYRDYELRIVN